MPVLLPGSGTPAAAAWIVDAETGLVYEDNLSLASMGRDIKRAAALTAAVSARAATYLADRDVVSLTGDFFGDLHEQYSGLDQRDALLRLAQVCPGRMLGDARQTEAMGTAGVQAEPARRHDVSSIENSARGSL